MNGFKIWSRIKFFQCMIGCKHKPIKIIKKKGTEIMEIKELVTNEEFKKAASKVETVDEAVALCKAYGVEITGDELVEAIKKSHDAELSEADLDNVAGGGFVAGVYALGFLFGMSPLGALVLCGAAVACGVILAKHTR